MNKPKADKTHTVRLPAGLAEELKAYTGQNLSTLVRYILVAMLEKKRREHAQNQINSNLNEVRDLVNKLPEKAE